MHCVGWANSKALVEEAELTDASEDRLIADELLSGVPGREIGSIWLILEIESWGLILDVDFTLEFLPDDIEGDPDDLSLLLQETCRKIFKRLIQISKLSCNINLFWLQSLISKE